MAGIEELLLYVLVVIAQTLGTTGTYAATQSQSQNLPIETGTIQLDCLLVNGAF